VRLPEPLRGRSQESLEGAGWQQRRNTFRLTVALPPEHFEALARLVAETLRDGRDDGFLNVSRAAEYLSTTPKAIYALVERQKLPHHRAGGRLLFDRHELRAWVEADR
jgi:excisionase family DNA binding protein